jgi:geranylgeranyl transferase type-2 subunit beta
MSASGYLDLLDAMLHPGLAGLSARFVDCQTRFVQSCRQPDGGFRGRRGGSDPYYTDFALRVLAWLAPQDMGQVANLLNAELTGSPSQDVVACFNLLHIRRLLEHRAVGNPMPFVDWLFQRLLPCGGFARSTDDPRVSAYHTFLGALCFQMLGVEMPETVEAIEAIQSLRRPDGGYAELAGQSRSQTNATAAAIGFLAMHGAVPPEQATETARFLAGMQSVEGGLKSHVAAQSADLLSTFTGSLTLAGIGGWDLIDASRTARFVRAAADPRGGFRASADDETPDVEYTYYGVGTLALLRIYTTSS